MIIWLILIALPGLAQQKQGNIWIFGRNAGLDFNTSPPTPITNTSLNTWEGCASIADEDGQLLFYTDGIWVWDKNNVIMPNGFSLSGDPSSTQSGVIVPKPGDENIYYIFTVDARIGELEYSTVDMRLNNGLGDVIEKNVRLLDSSTEKISSVAHANRKDIWVLGHEMGNNKYYAWLVTDQGVDLNPVISEVGSPHVGGGDESIGYLKFASDNRKVAVAGFGLLDFVEVFDFDNATGSLTFESKYTGFGADGPYGVEFSPSSQYLYISERVDATSLFQVVVGTPSGDINAAGTRLISDFNFGALQLAPDGKIYLARDERTYLGIIHEPDLPGMAANVELNGVFLDGRFSSLGLPTFIQSFFRNPDFTETAVCFTDTTRFEISADVLADLDSVSWDFGDPSTGSANNSTALSPVHIFSAPGEYTVTLTAYFDDISFDDQKTITIHPLPTLDLGSDRVLVQDQTLDINLTNTQSYEWQDGDLSSSRQITDPGWYSVLATNSNNCNRMDSLAVFRLTYTDTCQTDITRFNIETGNIVTDSITWDFDDPGTGAANLADGLTPSHEFSAVGNYVVSATFYFNDQVLVRSIPVEIVALPAPDLGPDETLFYGETRQLSAAGQGVSYLWQDNSTDDNFLVREAGTYWVEVTNAAGCLARDSVVIDYDQLIEVSLPQDTILCLGETLLLDVSLPEATYTWQDGSTNPTFLVDSPGLYWVEIVNAFQSRTKIDSILVDYYEFNAIDIIPEHVICSVRSIEVSATGAKNDEVYRWYDENMRLLEENNGTFTTPELNRTTDFFVTLSNGRCETDPVRWTVIYDEVFAEIIASDTLIEVGNTIELSGFGGDEFRWSPDRWLSSTTEQFITASPLRDITYNLTVRSIRGCEDMASIFIYVERDIKVPNVITPNNDGFNDTWKITNIELFPSNTVIIQDRQGNLIRKFSGYANDWDGTKADGTRLTTGTYFYIIDLNDPEFELYKGTISVIRR